MEKNIEKLFSAYRGKRIAVYGLGRETERYLPQLCRLFELVGLLDSFQHDGELYGLPIISLHKAIDLGVELIVVVARPGSCKAIARKIREVIELHEIRLMDIRGKDLLQETKVVYDLSFVEGYRYQDIMAEIASVDVVSFDLFDTLVIRNTYETEDVYEVMACHLREKGIDITSWNQKRFAEEKRLSQGHAPMLSEIYKSVLDDVDDILVSTEELAEAEFRTDLLLLEPRREMCRLLKDVKRLGKRVCITTDTYYSKEQIEELLRKNGIVEYDQLLISCEYGMGKTQGLFEKLIAIMGTKQVLHVGDDEISDIEYALQSGLKAFRIYSGRALFDLTGGLGAVDYVEGLSDKIRLGMFIAKIFNSPFWFEGAEKRLNIQGVLDMGYLCCAPIIIDYILWFEQELRSSDLKNIWFAARDGYIVQRVFHRLFPEVRSEYFLTSRTAAIRSGVECEEDLVQIEEMRFGGSIEENLYNRYGIREENVLPIQIQQQKKGILKYAHVILSLAQERRKNYRKYVDKLEIQGGAVAFMDFVAKGTTQFYLSRIINRELRGFYFLQPEPESMKKCGVNVSSFYTEDERENSSIYELYYILETILTAPHSSISGFDNNGVPIYAEETRTPENLKCIARAQSGLEAYAERYVEILPRVEWTTNKKLSEVFLKLIGRVDILDGEFCHLRVEDPFFNRMTDVMDILQ